MDSELKKELNRIRGLIQNKDKPELFLEKEAKKNLFLRNLVRTGNFISDVERKLAKSLFEKYLVNREYETEADLVDLGNLVYNEIIVDRIQKTLNSQLGKNGEFFVNDKILKSLHDTEDQVNESKKRLGIYEVGKNTNELTAFQEAKKKFALHIAFNKHEYTTTCDSCGTSLLLRRRTKGFETLKHPFFAGRFYYNARGIELVKKGQWKKEQYAYVFRTSIYFVDWCIENEGKIVEIDGFSQDDIENFMMEKDYLRDGFVRLQKDK